MQPDYTFADALLSALARALYLVPADDAAGLAKLMQEAERTPEPVPAPPPAALVLPFGCVKYGPERRSPKIVPQMYVNGYKIGLGHYPYTPEGARVAALVRAAAVAEKERGGTIESVKRVAREAREAICHIELVQT